MEHVEEIRRLEGQGMSRSRIAEKMGVSRTTVAKYGDQVDFVVPDPVGGGCARSVLDPLKPVIDVAVVDLKSKEEQLRAVGRQDPQGSLVLNRRFGVTPRETNTGGDSLRLAQQWDGSGSARMSSSPYPTFESGWKHARPSLSSLRSCRFGNMNDHSDSE